MTQIAAIQMVSSNQVNDNLNQVEQHCTQAAKAGAKLVVLPENFAFMGTNISQMKAIAEQANQGPIQKRIKKIAQKLGLWIVAGTIPIKTATERVRAACMVFNAQGALEARYDKIHLFDVTVSEHETHEESQTIEPGDEIVIVNTPVGCLGLSVCYDLRFPELYQQLALRKADILVVPSAFTQTTGAAHWHVLLRSRAIETQCYVVAVNQAGRHPSGRTTYGHSVMIDPWGQIMGEIDAGPGCLVQDIELDYLQKIRTRFPCHQHHRLKTYQLLGTEE